MAAVSAHRPGGGDDDGGALVVDAEEGGGEAVRPALARFQPRAQVSCKVIESAGEVFGRADRLGEGQALGPGRRRAWPGDGFGRRAVGLVEPQRGHGAEAAGDLAARLAREFADALQAEPAQAGDGAGFQPQQRHRQHGERGLFLPWGEDGAGAASGGRACQRPRRAGRSGDGDAAGEAVAFQAG